MKKNSIEPFWDRAIYTSVPLKKKTKNKNIHTVYSPVVNFDAKVKTDLLERCLNEATLKCGMPFKNSFFYSIKQYMGKDNIEKYKKFREILESKNLVRCIFLLTNKEKNDPRSKSKKESL